MTIRRWLWPGLICLLVSIILLPISPLYRPIPSDDPSVYLYAGERLLEGAVPYRDVWDHKQPLAFIVYAFSLVLTPHSLWGIWLIEWLGLSTASVLGFSMLDRIAPRPLRFLAVLAFLLALTTLLWSFSLEELSLPLIVFVLWAFTRWIDRPAGKERIGLAFAVGLAVGMTFFLKQSLIAAGLTVGLYLFLDVLIRRSWRGLFDLTAIALGFALTAAVMLGYLAAGNALQDYQNAAFTFNLEYAGLGLLERVNAMLDAVEYMAGIPGLFLAFTLWLVCTGISLLQAGPWLARVFCARTFRPAAFTIGAGLIAVGLGGELVGGQPGLGLVQALAIATGTGLLGLGGLVSSRHLRERIAERLSQAPVIADTEDSGRRRQSLFFLTALYFPITLFMVSLSGRNYVYYFIPLTPFLMLSLGLVSAGLFHSMNDARNRSFAAVVLAALGLALAYNPILLLVSGYKEPRNPDAPEIVRYVQENTTPEQSIIVWGKFVTHTYFLSGRKAPTRYFYQAPLSLEEYNARFGVADEMLRDLQAGPPELFLFNAESGDPPAGKACPLPASDEPNSAGKIYQFVCDEYSFEEKLEEFWVFKKK